MSLESSLWLKEGSFNPANIKEVEEFFKAQKEKRVYFLSSVTGIEEKERQAIQTHVDKRKNDGFKVYDPYRHTAQDDVKMVRIFEAHRLAIGSAGTVDAVFNPTSKGSIADTGMAFMKETPINLVNGSYFINHPLGNVAGLVMVKYGTHNLNVPKIVDSVSETTYKLLLETREQLREAAHVEFTWDERNPSLIFTFGMIFASGKPFFLKNRGQYEYSHEKSFLNLLLSVHDQYNAHR
jgi:hypothetical protein